MRKLFLIPLMTLLCTVMAWADNVARIGETEYATLAKALEEADNGATITLLSTVNESVTISKNVTLAGNQTITQGLSLRGNATVTFAGININVEGDDAVNCTNTASEIILADGTTNTISAPSTNMDCFYGGSAASQSLTISGSGSLTLNSTHYAFHMANLVVTAPNVVANSDFYIYKSASISAGSYKEDPTRFVDASNNLITYSEESALYTVSSPVGVVAYNKTIYKAYTDALSTAVAKAEDGARIIMYASDNGAVAVSKNLTIEYGNYSVNVSAGEGYTKIDKDQRIVITNNPLAAYLQGESSDPYTVSADNDMRHVGQVIVKGTKVITINEDITVTCAYQDAGYSIIVPNGAKLTIYGKGTIAGDQNLIRVEKGGELVIGKADPSESLKMTTTVWDKVNYAINNYGKATINNAEIHAASAALNTYGVMDVNGGWYTGEAYSPNHRYCVTADDGSQLNIKNARVFGVHGALACQGSEGSNIGGSARIENCELVATHTPYLTKKNTTSIHYGIYSASGGIVSVYNSKMRSTQQARAIHIGNNDAWNTFGLVYVYEGCMVRAIAGTGKKNGNPSAKTTAEENRIWVQQRSETDKEILFPISVDQSSQWYTAAKTGGEAPLPAGYKWKQIIKEGEPTEDQVLDAAAYDEGYRWITVSTAEKAQDATGATIPWQQATTWVDTPTGDDVPDKNTSVVIPVGKTVVVDKNETDKDAKAEQVTIAGEGASLTVQDGTTLNVENGVNIADGGKLVVDAGAMVTIGAGGLVAGNEESVEVKMTEGKSGIFMIAPSVTENTHPMAKVELVSKACYVPAEDRYIWQRFGVPAYMEGMTKANVDYDHDTYPTAWMKIEHQNWADFEDGDVFKPFTCYGLTTTNTNPGAVYTFTSALMGNGNAELDLADNWNYYANSYTAPINIPQMLADFKATYPNVSGTVYLYRAYDNWWYEINNAAYEFGVDENDQTLPVQIAPMQAFIFQRRGEGENPEINYLSQIWNPIMNPSAGAPTRNNSSFNKAMIEIMAEDGTKDAIRLIEGYQFSADFDNSYDAAKYMKDNSFNLFANADDEKLGTIASDNFDGTMISMNTKGQTSFTMTIKHVNGMNYAIRDMLTGTEVEMAEGATYMFSVPANANVEGRFQIVSVAKMPTAIDNIETTAALKGIYTVTGQYVGNNYHILPNGVYVVDGKKIVK